jgi:outer membrane biosynthesis protein TonB
MSQSRSTIRNRISLASGAAETRSPLGLFGSVALHIAIIIAATVFTWAHTLDIVQESPPVVPVDLVTLAKKTSIIPTVRPEKRIAPEPVVEPKPQPPVVQPPPKIEVPTEPAPRDVTPPKPQVKPQPPQPKKPTVDPMDALLNKLSSAAQPSNAHVAAQTHKGFGAQNANTMDLVDSLRNQIAQCWSPPAGAPNANDLVVNYDLFLNPDGSVAQTPHLTADSMAAVIRNAYTRAAAEAAARAIYECAPYKLPADRYSEWREINPFHFDPRQMMGQ